MRTPSRTLTIILASALAIVALGAAACGDDNKSTGGSTPSGAGTPISANRSPVSQATAVSPTRPPATQSAAAATTIKVGDGAALGSILVDAAGLTLYTFNNDTAGNGKSACEAACSNVWTPLTIASGAPTKPAAVTGDLATITRTDGKLQVTYKGMPLYHFVNDKAPGDTGGNGVSGVWFAAKP